MTIDQIEKKYCNGNFNNNPLLMLMLIQFAFGDLAERQMLKRGWLKKENTKFRGIHRFAIELRYIYLGDGGRGYGPRRIESLTLYYISQSTIKFFLDNNLGFRIYSFHDLVEFLKRLSHIRGLPKGISISNIIKFEHEEEEGFFEWNRDIFEKHLVGSKKGHISQEEYDMFIKLAE